MKTTITQEEVSAQVRGLARWLNATARWRQERRQAEAAQAQRLRLRLELTLLQQQLAETEQEIQRKTP